ncbi:MAG: sulfatase [bacterium]|nr:sulfatase [bacterium]
MFASSSLTHRTTAYCAVTSDARGSHRASIRSAILAGIFLLACDAPQPKTIEAPDVAGSGIRPDVIFVSIDTLRADHVGAYGYRPPTTPVLDALASEGIVFEQAIAHAPSTLPSHVSMFTSKIPIEHRVMVATERPLPPDMPVLAEIFADSGYRTAAFHSGGQLTDDLEIDRGFDVWKNVGVPFAPTVAEGCSWLTSPSDEPSDQKEPAFLFLHTYEVHHPYRPRPDLLALFESDYSGPLPKDIEIDAHLRRINDRSDQRLELTDADLAHIIATYDAELRSVDESFGDLLECIRKNGRYDETLVLVTSDHGEEFAEHGWVGWHSHSLFDELLRVPLIIKLPAGEGAGSRVAAMVRLIDLAPTLLAASGIDVPESFRGRSLLGHLDPERSEDLIATTEIAIAARDNANLLPGQIAVRSGKFKLIGRHLFDLENDPRETTNVAAEHRPVLIELRKFREAALRLAATIDVPSASEPSRLDEETLRELEALGYLE